MSYQPKTYRKQGGDEFVIASGGKITIESGGLIDDERFSATEAVVGTGTLAIPVTSRYVSKSTGGAEALTLADGVIGQVLTLTITAASGIGTLTPATGSGWVTVLFIAAGDTMTFEYIDDTVGWIVIGSAGVLASPLITL